MDWKPADKQRLVRAILALQTEEETANFLRDLLTKNEIGELARRLTAAEMLSRKESYAAVEKATGLSSTTVARVAKWLKGKEGGYRTILARLRKSPQ
ncbi:MAG: DNA-binding transcriptional regulator [Candidatus Liptonbacteria bacterium]|nr:DNA-binding transcriptional regulator [Candidatus Liptonbacteria bacterium]